MTASDSSIHLAIIVGFFTTPHQIKARAFWVQTKIIDDFASATITVANQLGYAAGSQTADVFIPNNYIAGKPVGIYIHVSAGDSASLPRTGVSS